MALPYAFASFYALTIPFTGVLFLRRQWVVGRAFEHITPGEMYTTYYGGNAMRLLTVLVAFLFSVPYLGVQLRASGDLFHVLTDGMIGIEIGMFALSAIVMIYVASGGLRSVAYVDCAQCILLALGIVILGGIAISFAGGWGGFTDGLAAYVKQDLASGQKTHPRRPLKYRRYAGNDPGRIFRGRSTGQCLDRHDVPHLHVRAHGHPILTRLFHVVLLQ